MKYDFRRGARDDNGDEKICVPLLCSPPQPAVKGSSGSEHYQTVTGKPGQSMRHFDRMRWLEEERMRETDETSKGGMKLRE